MEQNLTSDDLLEFESLTQWPITNYLFAVQDFLTNQAPNITNFYNGTLSTLDRLSVNNLQSLISQTQDLFSTINLNRFTLASSQGSYKWWILIDNIEGIDNALLLLDNTSKWLRSSLSSTTYTANTQVQIKFNAGQTLESVQRDVLNDPNWDDTWETLAINNNLQEEDYTPSAGILLQASYLTGVNSQTMTSIVDNPVGDRVLGLDLQAKLQFDPVTQDLVVLSPQDTFLQTVNILITLKLGDNPAFPDQGLPVGVIAGSNVNVLNFPAIFRTLSTLFKNDDTIASFSLDTISKDQDAIRFNFTVTSRLGTQEKLTISSN